MEYRTLKGLLKSERIELDQRLRSAIELAGSRVLRDHYLLHAVYRLNSVVTRYLQLDEKRIKRWGGMKNEDELEKLENVDLGRIRLPKWGGTHQIIARAVENRKNTNTLGTLDFLRSVIEVGLETGDEYAKRPYSIDLIILGAGGSLTTPLKNVVGLRQLLERIYKATAADEDFQYLLTLEDDRLIFRVASVLDDYVQVNNSGILIPQRAILTHFKDQFAGFTSDEIQELEELLNSDASRERDFQKFFEEHTHFLRMWDYREVYPHVCLARPEGPLIPDFLLTDRELQRAAIVELKLPKPKLINRQHNRERFSAAIMEARAQLLLYRDWFRERRNRMELKRVVGMEIYEPSLTVVIGRSSEFADEIDRQKLRANHPDIEVVTYDDILRQAERRKIIIAD